MTSPPNVRLRPTVLAALLLVATVGAQKPGSLASALRPLEKVCRDLTAADLPREVAAVRQVLENLDYKEKALERLDKTLEKTKKAKPAQAARLRNKAVTAVGRVAKKLASMLGDAPDRAVVARAVLALDSEQQDGRAALGQQRVDGAWVSADEAARIPRRREINAMLHRARKLPIELKISPGEHPTLVHAHGGPGLLLEYGKVRVWTTWPQHKAERALRESLRLTAVSNFLLFGELEIPKNVQIEAILFDARATYLKAFEFDHKAGKLSAEATAAAPRARTYFTETGYGVFFDLAEADFEASFGNHLLYVWNDALHNEYEQPCLIAAHANWLCMRYLGATMPALLWSEGGDLRDSSESRRTSAETKLNQERTEMRTLESAGFAGARSWLRWQVQHGEDAPWSRAMVDRVGKVGRDELLKATFVLDYLYGFGKLEPVLVGTRKQVKKPIGEVIAAFEKVLGKPLPEFEDEWRAWMVGGGLGVVQRLGGQGEQKLTRDESAVLQQLGKVRKAAFSHMVLPEVQPLKIDAELSEGAALHAAYLEVNREQLSAWPDAHEEYPDKERFSARGQWAGLHSVICPGVKRPSDAIDSWMGTFYHRLPLIEPGLLRIGWAQRGDIAVLDSGSIVREITKEWHVAWPYDGMTKVPTRFNPELPNPVPGEDQTEWGYPITLRLQPGLTVNELQMELRKGSPTGTVIECWYSSPQKPTNDHSVPDNAWCLIPKAHLSPNTQYHVIVTFTRVEKTLQWSFRT